MAINPCAPCDCTQAFINDVVSFRLAVLQALCNISSNTSAGGVAPTSQSADTATTQSVVQVNDTSTPVLAANPARIGGWVKNISDSDIVVSFGPTAALGAPTLLAPGASLEFGRGFIYRGAVSAIHAIAGQQKALEVLEF